LEIALDKITSTEALIKIKLKENDYQPKVDEKIKDYSRKANLKGFRQGKVPIPVIKKMFGKAIVAEEINSLLSAKLKDYISENDIQILSDPIPNKEKSEGIDWENQTEFEFEYNIGMAGEFELKPGKISAIRYSIKINDKLVDQTIENLRKQHGEMTNPDTSEEGDVIFGDITHMASETTHTHAIDLTKVEKKVKSKFLGLKKDDKVTFDMKKAIKDSHEASHLMGVSEDEYKKMKGDFELLVKNINRQIPTEINQELFDKTYGKDVVKDEVEFKSKIENSVKENYQHETEGFLERSIQKSLLEKTKIELPENFLKERLYENAAQDEKLTTEDVDNYFEDYLKDIKWSLIQNRLIKENEIKVEHTDVVEEAKNMIRKQFGASPQFAEQLESSIDEFANNYLSAEEGKNYRQLYNKLTVDKVFLLLKEKVSIKEKNISADDFGKLSV
jgi:trigger factor